VIRIKSQWFNEGKGKTPKELAGAVSFIAWRIAENALKNTRRADFDVAVGAQYFAFLSEFLIFLVQVADRIAYVRFTAEVRQAFTSELANRIAETLAGNQADLLGGTLSGYKSGFIERLNQRAGEYAEFEYGSDGPSFSFMRYLAHCMIDVVDERDKNWVIDQMMAVEAPEAVELVEKAMRGLLETDSGKRPAKPGRRSARKASGTD
jgi:hypothetical protein